jgi:hypothetical protein
VRRREVAGVVLIVGAILLLLLGGRPA